MRLIAAVCFAVLGAAVGSGEGVGIRVRVTNPLNAARPMETVEVAAAALAGRVGPRTCRGSPSTDARTGREVLTQAVDEDGDGTPTGWCSRPTSRPARRGSSCSSRGEPRKPRLGDYRVYGRFVRERHDDFAWENDRVAFRIYGQALETFEKEPLTSSAVDAWGKRTPPPGDERLVPGRRLPPRPRRGRRLLPGGGRRGCGGRGLVVDGALAVSKNFRSLARARERARSGSSSRSSTPSGRSRG